jgi:hypothetical protein
MDKKEKKKILNELLMIISLIFLLIAVIYIEQKTAVYLKGNERVFLSPISILGYSLTEIFLSLLIIKKFVFMFLILNKSSRNKIISFEHNLQNKIFHKTR